MSISKEEITSIANRFRCAILSAKDNREFDFKDRMQNFPYGCCDDTADLFAHYLYHEFGIPSLRVDGKYYSDNPEDSCGHSWQIVDGLVIDLTGSQFKHNSVFHNYDKDVYVGEEDDFYRMFEIRRCDRFKGIECLGIDSHARMYKLYEIIMKYFK